jgi:hypothetical protein
LLVGNDDIDVAALQDMLSFEGGGCGQQFVGLAPKGAFECLGDVGLVIDQKDGRDSDACI